VDWDAALEKQSGCMGLGVVIRDHLGRLVATRSVMQLGGFELNQQLHDEAMATLMAIRTSREWVFGRFVWKVMRSPL
jgi:hypothetical protein